MQRFFVSIGTHDLNMSICRHELSAGISMGLKESVPCYSRTGRVRIDKQSRFSGGKILMKFIYPSRVVYVNKNSLGNRRHDVAVSRSAHCVFVRSAFALVIEDVKGFRMNWVHFIGSLPFFFLIIFNSFVSLDIFLVCWILNSSSLRFTFYGFLSLEYLLIQDLE